MKKLFVILGILFFTSTWASASPTVQESVRLLRTQVQQVSTEVAQGDEAGAVAAAEAAYETWKSLPPAVRRVIEKKNPGTEEKLANLDEEAVAQIEGSSASSNQAEVNVNYQPKPVARYTVAKQVQGEQGAASTSTQSSDTTYSNTAAGTGNRGAAAGAYQVTTGQNGNTSSAQSSAAGAAYNPVTQNWAAGVHRGNTSATQNIDGSYDTSHNGQTTVASSQGSADVTHTGTGDDLGSGNGSYTTSTSVDTGSGQSYENSTDIFGNSGLGQTASASRNPKTTQATGNQKTKSSNQRNRSGRKRGGRR